MNRPTRVEEIGKAAGYTVRISHDSSRGFIFWLEPSIGPNGGGATDALALAALLGVASDWLAKHEGSTFIPRALAMCPGRTTFGGRACVLPLGHAGDHELAGGERFT